MALRELLNDQAGNARRGQRYRTVQRGGRTVHERLEHDFEFYAPRCCGSWTRRGREIPFKLKPPQIRLARAVKAQFEAGRPQRARILKARQVGFSTEAVGMTIQRTTSRPNHLARHVAQDKLTAGALFDKGKKMWTRMPGAIQPELAFSRDGMTEKLMHFGVASKQQRDRGHDGAGVAGHDRHGARDGRRPRSDDPHAAPVGARVLAAQGQGAGPAQRGPDEPDTLILDESTANGPGDFKDAWEMSEAGADGYYPCFTPWFEENTYRTALNADEAAELEADLGEHPLYGEDELELVELMR
jgi:hypothetical protein